MHIFTPTNTDDLNPRAKRWVGQPVTVQSWHSNVAMLEECPGGKRVALIREFGLDVPESDLKLNESYGWISDPSNVIELGEWLNNQGEFADTEAMLYFFSKPWKWCREWYLYQAWRNSSDAEFKQNCIDALNDGKVTARDLLLKHCNA